MKSLLCSGMMCLLVLSSVAPLQGNRDVNSFNSLQVSSAMTVEVKTDPKAKAPSVSIAADDQALGWTVNTMVLPLTFGSTLFLGMDGRASRQGFQWSDKANSATIVVPRPLSSISVTGGAKVEADMVAWELSASDEASLIVQQVQPYPSNRSRLFQAESGGRIIVHRGGVEHAMIQAFGQDTLVDLSGAEIDVAYVEADDGAQVAVNATGEIKVWCHSNASEKTQVKIKGGAAFTDLSSAGCNISHEAVSPAASPAASNSSVSPAASSAASNSSTNASMPSMPSSSGKTALFATDSSAPRQQAAMEPEETCAGLEGVNAACKDDVEWAFNVGKYTEPNSYKTLETIEGVNELAATIHDYHKGFYCGIIGKKKEQRCALPPCTCSRPPCDVCKELRETVDETGIVFP